MKEHRLFCENCGARLAPGVRFCENCGLPIKAEATPAPVAAEPKPEHASAAARPPVAAIPQRKPVPKAASPPVAPPRRAGIPLVAVAVGCLVLIVAGLALIVAIGGPILLSMRQKSTPRASSSPSSPSERPDTAPSSAKKEPETSAPVKDHQDLNSARTYLPTPGTRYTFHEKYPDGDEGDYEVIAGEVGGRGIVSILEIITPDVNGASHFIERADGIYLAPDPRPRSAELWLPNGLVEGRIHQGQGLEFTVKQVNASLDLGFIRFEKCLVVERNFKKVRFMDKAYYAPGCGLVMTKDPGGTVMRKLTSLNPISANEASRIVERNSPNIGKLQY